MGVVSAKRLNIQAARLIKTRDGSRIYVIEITKPDFAPVAERSMEELVEAVRDALGGRLDVEEEIKKKHVRLSKKERVVKFNTKIKLSNSILRDYTVVEVKTQDRLGLLYYILKALRSLGLEIHVAKVSTEGNRAVDTFYVTREGEKLKEHQFSEVVRVLKAALD